MQSITIKTKSCDSKILIGETLDNLQVYLPSKKCVIITDENIQQLYGKRFPQFPVITMGLGEKKKDLETIRYLLEKLVDLEADRSTFIIAIGGGIVCDVAGFAASVYMRGLPYGFVSTTLLSQVDASVGGKNGINFMGYKNMVGVFNQPEFVLIDTEMLQTLPDDEFYSGFAEIIKAAAIKDESFFTYLENHYNEALSKDKEVLDKIIFKAVMIKAKIVEKDEKEKDERKKLNFGHTFAHAIEHETMLPHGMAVSIGMALAAAISVKSGLLHETEKERLLKLIKKYQLPVETGIDIPSLFNAMKKDKKRKGDSLQMIFLDRIGNAIIKPVSIHQLENQLL